MASTFKLPVLSLAELENKEGEASLAVAFRQAAISTGFLQLTNHGVPAELTARMFDYSKAFFALSPDVKAALARDSFTNRGYEIIGGQALEGSLGATPHEGEHLLSKEMIASKLPDQKEGLMMGNDRIKEGDKYWGRFGHGNNVLPSEEALPGLRKTVAEYYDAVFPVVLKVMRIVAISLDLSPEDSFTAEVTQDPITALRLLHYPPTKLTDITGIGAHTDFGFVTLLATSGEPGLELYFEGQWLSLEPETGAFIVNIGDSLSRMTSGKYKSSLHRVINKSGFDRFSIPMFLEGNSDFVVKPLDAPEDSTEEFETVEQVLRGRFDSTYVSPKSI